MPEFAVWLNDNSTHMFSAPEAFFVSIEADDPKSALRIVQEMADEQSKTDPDFRAHAVFALPIECARLAVDEQGPREIKDANAVLAPAGRTPRQHPTPK